MNDPNGLCRVDGVWHAFFQHDPDSDDHGRMHWGHATSSDLVRWTEQPVALEPDDLGVIYSGSVVIDDDDTAGFGRGALVAVFTHHLDGVERQSLAFSHDAGLTWQKFADNPVLQSAERDFRDPKVFRHVAGGTACWVMSLAVGGRIEFHRSVDLRRWEHTGSYAAAVEGDGPWECPDLVRLRRPDGSPAWLLTFCVADGGPHGHSGTFGVIGDFAGGTFHPTGEPGLLDRGPDFYAAQSFAGAPDGAVVLMGWMSSWRYAGTLPSAGRRGVLTLPRRVDVTTDAGSAAVRVAPAVDLSRSGVAVDGQAWRSRSERALHIRGRGDVEVRVLADDSPVGTIRVGDGIVSVERHEPLVEHYAGTYAAPIAGDGRHEIVVDHGTIEVFAAGGSVTMTALLFAGDDWRVVVEGDASLSEI
jgi:sucrose-6-phosphate hydrolase SacC (GH32 family)